MFRTILVPLDGSSFGEHALPIACSIARRSGARLELAHVHVSSAALALDVLPSADEALEAQSRARELAYLHGLVRQLRGDVDAEAVLLDEPVVTAIHNHAVAAGVELIVMTTHGRGALARFWLGSVADTLVRRTTLPLLLVRPREQPADFGAERRFHRLLVPLDGSALAEQIIPHALRLGQPNDAEFVLLHVAEAPLARQRGADGRDPRHAHLAGRTPAEYLEEVACQLRAQGARVRYQVGFGPAAGVILSFARDNGADLIAMETHGRGGVTRLLLGSVADVVLRSALCPVLLHRPGGEH